MANHQHLTTIT